MQKAESLFGNIAGKTGSLKPSLPKLGGLTSMAKYQAPGNLADALMSAQSPPPPEPDSATAMNSTMNPSTNQPNIMGESYTNGEDLSSQEYSSSPFAPQNLEGAIMQIVSNGGSLKDVSEFLGVAKTVNDLRAATQPKEAKPLSGEARNRSLKAQSGLRSIGTLEEALMSDPGAFQRQALPNPFGLTARITGTTDVRAATDNLVDIIARMRSGAAITDSEAKRFARLLPQPGDSADSARRKLETIRAELESYTQPDGGGSLEDALLQYQ